MATHRLETLWGFILFSGFKGDYGNDFRNPGSLQTTPDTHVGVISSLRLDLSSHHPTLRCIDRAILHTLLSGMASAIITTLSCSFTFRAFIDQLVSPPIVHFADQKSFGPPFLLRQHEPHCPMSFEWLSSRRRRFCAYDCCCVRHSYTATQHASFILNKTSIVYVLLTEENLFQMLMCVHPHSILDQDQHA